MLTQNVYFEERAATIHIAVPNLTWFPTNRLRALEAWLFPLIQCGPTTAAEPFWTPLANGCSLLNIPDALKPFLRRRKQWHEVAHELLDVGLTGLADSATEEEKRKFPLLKEAEKKEELLTTYLVDAIQMPAWKMFDADIPELARRSGFSYGMLARRLRSLRGQPFELNYVPNWSAARFYRLEWHPTTVKGLSPSMLLFRRNERELPDFRIPIPEGPDQHDREMRIKADLLALRAKQFAGKYGYFATQGIPVPRSPFARALGVRVGELRAWARERTGPEDDDV